MSTIPSTQTEAHLFGAQDIRTDAQIYLAQLRAIDRLSFEIKRCLGEGDTASAWRAADAIHAFAAGAVRETHPA